MQSNPLHVAVILGSTREGRLAPVVARWFARHAESRQDMTFDVIDLAEVHLPDVMSSTPSAEVAAVGTRLAAADAFVVITPEYNHSFPAPLKSAIDWYGAEWKRKVVGFVSYGGISGGLRAVEQLRLIFAELHAATVRDSVSFHGVHTEFDAEGNAQNHSRASRAATAMLNQLAWWGFTLREGRAKEQASVLAQTA